MVASGKIWGVLLIMSSLKVVWSFMPIPLMQNRWRHRPTLAPLKSTKDVSASRKERREEDRRRRERKSDVVIGKTSAVPGEKDFDIDVTATEELWMKHATALEQEIYRETDKGLDSLKMVRCLL